LRRTQWFAEWMQDVRFAVRQFAKAPGFTMIAVLTLALGIGANGAIFSVVHRLLLAPLPYPNGNRIVIPMQQEDNNTTSIDLALIQVWRSSARSVELVAAATQAGLFDVSSDGSVVANPNGWMTANYLQTLGVRPVIGRAFTRDEEAAAQPTVAMISEGLLNREHGGSATAIGSTIQINKRSYTIVGVTPAGLPVPLEPSPPPDIWLPRSIDRLDKNGGGPARVFARLRDGISIDVATRELQAIATRVSTGAKPRPPVRLMRVQDFVDAREVRSVQVLFFAVGVLLLIACANVANLLLARAWTRRREFAVRTALGAGRGRLARQVLTESVMLALAGAMGGVGVAWGTLRVIIALRPPELEHLAEVRVEPAVLFWSLGVSLATGLLFGCAPAIVAGTRRVGDALRSESRSGTANAFSQRVRSSLIVVEIAMSLVLLIGAGLLTRSFVELLRVRLGFDADGLVAVSGMINATAESGQHSIVRARALERARSVPGVVGATVGGMPSAPGPTRQVEAEPNAAGISARASDVGEAEVSEDYFRLARIAVIEGRAPDSANASADWKAGKSWGSSGEVVVNRTLARRLWPNHMAIGRRVRLIMDDGTPGQWSTVVGMVDDVRSPAQHGDVGALQMYSLLPPSFPVTSFLIRSPTSGETALPALERALKSVDPRLMVWRVTAGEKYVRDARAPTAFAMALLIAFAATAVTIAGLGLYGVIQYSVHQRVREIGVRVALGASPRAVAQLVVGNGLVLALGGIALGTLIAAATTRLLATMLYGVSAADPLTFAAIAVLVATIAIVASYVPARRALRISPVEALRAD
jgi:putative ABC transport system permease protein